MKRRGKMKTIMLGVLACCGLVMADAQWAYLWLGEGDSCFSGELPICDWDDYTNWDIQCAPPEVCPYQSYPSASGDIAVFSGGTPVAEATTETILQLKVLNAHVTLESKDAGGNTLTCTSGVYLGSTSGSTKLTVGDGLTITTK